MFWNGEKIAEHITCFGSQMNSPKYDMFQNRNKDVPQNPKQRDVFSSTIQNTHNNTAAVQGIFNTAKHSRTPPKIPSKTTKKIMFGTS